MSYKDKKEKYRKQLIEYIPEESPNGRRLTLNNMGGATSVFDSITKEFIDFITVKRIYKLRSLEVGAGYGDVALDCLKRKARYYTLNDLVPRHIEIIKLRILLEKPTYLNYVTLASGNFLKIELKKNHFDVILISRVLYFFDPKKMTSAFEKLYGILCLKGRIYLTTMSPFIGSYKPFLNLYYHKRKNGVIWPSYVKDFIGSWPLNLVDLELMVEKLEAIGFRILKALEFPLIYKVSIR